MGGAFAIEDFLSIFHTAGSEIDFTTQDGFDAGFFAGLIEIDGAVEVAVIGHGDGRHAEFGCAGSKFLGADHAIEKRVGGVKMEMDEGVRHARGELSGMLGRGKRIWEIPQFSLQLVRLGK